MPVCILRSFSSGWKRKPKPDVRRTSSPRMGLRIKNFFELLPWSS